MSNDVTTPSGTAEKAAGSAPVSSRAANKSPDKGKGKAPSRVEMDEDDDEDEDDEEDGGEDEDEDDEMDSEDDELAEIDPRAILPASGRRTRGVKVDYTSQEALEKAGLGQENAEDEEDSYTHDEMEH